MNEDRTSRRIRVLFWVFFGLSCFSIPAFAQKGSIHGIVVDSETGETLIGANVVLEGTTTGSTTDLDGRYEIRGLDPGVYTVLFSYIGYDAKTVRNVTVKPGEATLLDLSLTPQAIGLGEIVVEAEAVRNAEAALLRERQKAAAVSDAISAEAISRSASSTAADAMLKVTGASVVDGKYVVVRGLQERYSTTHLNGVELPTADPDRKAVQLDLFPSNLLDNVITLKTFTPDRPGNFSGGLVDIGTKSFPAQFDMKFSASTSFDTETHFGADFFTYPGGKQDWLGFDDGSRDIPALLKDPSMKVPNAVQARIAALQGDTEQAELLDAISRSFNPVMAPLSGAAPTNQSYSLSLGNQSNVLGRPLGYVAGVTYSRKASSYTGGETGRYALSSLDAGQLLPELVLEDAKSVSEVSWGGLVNFAYKPTAEHELSLNTLYSRGGESVARYQEGTWPKEFARNDSTSRFQNRVLGYTERELYSAQLRGKHYLKDVLDATVEWSGSLAQTSQDEPDLRFFASVRRVLNGNPVYSARHSGFEDPSRYFRNLDEGNQAANIDVSVPFKQWTGLNSSVKVGGAYTHSAREFRERIFQITPNRDFDGNTDAFFSSQNMGAVNVDTLGDGRYRYTFGNVVTDRSKPRNNYDGDMSVGAVYGMLDVPLTQRLRFVGGARVETTRLNAASQDSTQGVGRLDNNDVLPSMNLTYQVREGMNLRAAATRTLARPTFREIAPFASFEFINGAYLIGNPGLERTLIANFDVRWEWFTRPGEILAVSTFYKHLQQPIERTILGGTNGQIQYQNVDEAQVYGLEFEARKRLDFVHPVLQLFAVGGNISFVRSRIDVPQTELEVRRAIDPDADDTRQLQGQSPYLVNVDLVYENPNSGTTASVYYNVFGSRLAAVSKGGTPDVYERPRPDLDLIVSQRLLGNLQAKVTATNLLNARYEETYRFRGADYAYQIYPLGRTFSLGVSYSL